MEENNINKEETLDELLERINDEQTGNAIGEQMFKIKSDIGRDDHRAFMYHSTFKKHVWVLPMYCIIPFVIAGIFTLSWEKFSIVMFLIIAALAYIILFGMAIIGVERRLKKIERENPNTMKITPTTFTFFENRIYNFKKGKNTKIPYTMLVKVCPTKSRVFLYFDNNKAIVIRNEDISVDANKEEFIEFIKSKVKGKSK